MSVRPSNNRLSPLIVIRPINTLLCGQNLLPVLVVMLIALSTFLCGRHWAERRTALQRVDACQQSERYNKVCDPRSSWFVTLSYRRRAVERSGSTGPTTLSQLALRAGSSTTMMAGDEPARVNNFGHFQTF